MQRLQQAILRHAPSLQPHAPAELGEGVVTMLFAQIDDPTGRARAAGAGWNETVAACRTLVISAARQAGGRIEGADGTVVHAYFSDPNAAADAAIEAQLALRGHLVADERRRAAGPHGRAHWGSASRSATSYEGLEVHFAERVTAAGSGGQILVSAAAHGLLAPRFELVDLGEHRLPDFPDAERLWFLAHDERGPTDFPSLQTEPVRPTNLPADPRRLIGREQEIDALWTQLTEEDRLVTIIGLGGTGKTRLAAAAAERLLSRFKGGVWLVSLAGVREPDALLPAIAAALGVDDAGPLESALVRRLHARPTLLVLDNFEQLVDAAPTVEALLERAPDSRALVTSQLPLRVARERLLRLGPLAPDSAAALFHERAAAAAPDYQASEHKREVEAICARIDGVPLAVELAAARVSNARASRAARTP